MEVVLGAEDQSLALLDALDLVRPLPGNLDGRLDCLGASVHRQHHIIPKHLLHLLGPLGKDIVVERARAEGQSARLLGERLDELRVAMPLVDGAVGGEEVEVVTVLRIPDADTLGAGEDDGQGVVVVGGELGLGCDSGGGGGGVEAGIGGDVAGGGSGVIGVRSHDKGSFWRRV